MANTGFNYALVDPILKPSFAAFILKRLTAFIFFDGFKKLIAPTKKRITNIIIKDSMKNLIPAISLQSGDLDK